MNNDLTLFEQLVIWLSRNRRQFTIGSDIYNHRVYIHGNYTFMEYSAKEVAVMGTDFYFKSTNPEELGIMIDAIVGQEVSMLEIIKERKVRYEKEYYINFDCKDDHSCGFIFPANSDETPALDKMTEEAKMNYYACEASTNKFDRWFEEREVRVVDYAVGKCKCGHEVELVDEAWMGAVQCEKCGKWYNIYGQELVDPKYWEEDGDL